MDDWDWSDYEDAFGIGSNEPDLVTNPWWTFAEPDADGGMGVQYGGIDVPQSYLDLVEQFESLSPEQSNDYFAYALSLPEDLSDEEYTRLMNERFDTYGTTPDHAGAATGGGETPDHAGAATGSGSGETPDHAGAATDPGTTPDHAGAATGSQQTGNQQTGNQQTGNQQSSNTQPKPAPTGLGKILADAGLLKDGKVNPLVGLGLSALTRKLGGSSAQSRPVGYQGGIPNYVATRSQIAPTAPVIAGVTPPVATGADRRPGSGGRSYFTDVQYAPKPVTAAGGGLMGMARGRYLAGHTDGMADKIPANIDGRQEARLSHGEFVVPADVVSHLGNGNSEAGAKQLYSMMDRIRKARTGTTQQGRQINPNKYTPA